MKRLGSGIVTTLLIMLCADIALAGPAFVQQSTTAAYQGGNVYHITINGVTAGDALVLFAADDHIAQGSSSSVSDNNSGSWTESPNAPSASASDSAYLDSWYSLNHASGNTVISWTNTSQSLPTFLVVEISGIATSSATDGGNTLRSGNGAGSTTASTGTFNSGNASDMLISGISTYSNNGTPTGVTDYGSTGGTATQLNSSSLNTSVTVTGAYQVVAATGNYGHQYSYSSAVNSAALIFALKAPAAPTSIAQHPCFLGGKGGICP